MSPPHTVGWAACARVELTLLSAAVLAGWGCTSGSAVEVDAGALAARAAPIPTAPPDAGPTARPDAFPACVPLAIVDDSVLAPGGGDAAALARMSRCDALTELRIVDLDLPPALTAAPLNLDLTPLMNLASLKVLMLGDCRCRGWDALARHPGLHELAVGDLFAPADVAALGRITGLERLVLGGRVPGGIAPLGQLVGLSSLILQDRQITDLTALAGLRSLRELALFDLPVADFAPIAQLELEHLEVHGAPLTALSDLPLSPALKTLKLPRTGVADLDALARCPKLQWLDLDGAPVRSITALQDLGELSHLSLADTRVTDLSPLHRLKQLRSINLSGLRIDDAEIRALQSRFPQALILHDVRPPGP